MGSYEHGNELSLSMNDWTFDLLGDCWFLNTDCVMWRWLEKKTAASYCLYNVADDAAELRLALGTG